MATFLKALFSAIFDGLRAYFSERARDAAMREIGRAEHAAEAAREITDAQTRMLEANAQPVDRDHVAGRLRDGSA